MLKSSNCWKLHSPSKKEKKIKSALQSKKIHLIKMRKFGISYCDCDCELHKSFRMNIVPIGGFILDPLPAHFPVLRKGVGNGSPWQAKMSSNICLSHSLGLL